MYFNVITATVLLGYEQCYQFIIKNVLCNLRNSSLVVNILYTELISHETNFGINYLFFRPTNKNM